MRARSACKNLWPCFRHPSSAMLPPQGSHGGVVVHPLNISELGFEGMIEHREWLAVSGLGGYASSTLCGLNTRKYHGLLVAAMSPPVRRMVILSTSMRSSTAPPPGFPVLQRISRRHLPTGTSSAPRLQQRALPGWAYQADGFTIEKSLRLLGDSNTVCLSYPLLACDKPVKGSKSARCWRMRPRHELMHQ